MRQKSWSSPRNVTPSAGSTSCNMCVLEAAAWLRGGLFGFTRREVTDSGSHLTAADSASRVQAGSPAVRPEECAEAATTAASQEEASCVRTRLRLLFATVCDARAAGDAGAAGVVAVPAPARG